MARGAKQPKEKYAVVPIAALVEHPDNAREGDVEAIAAGIRAHGFYGAVIVRTKGEGEYEVLAGWHRTRAASEVGMTEVPVMFHECDDDTARNVVLADNATADRGGYDERVRADLLKRAEERGALERTGHDRDAFEELLARAEASTGTAPPSPPEGGHRIHGRQIVLNFDAARYDRVIAALEQRRKDRGEEDYTGVVRELFR